VASSTPSELRDREIESRQGSTLPCHGGVVYWYSVRLRNFVSCNRIKSWYMGVTLLEEKKSQLPWCGGIVFQMVSSLPAQLCVVRSTPARVQGGGFFRRKKVPISCSVKFTKQ
jgi:hypothetical protein